MTIRQAFWLGAVLSAALAVPVSAGAQTWSAIGIGDAPTGNYQGYGINNLGQVAGNYVVDPDSMRTPYYGFVTGANGDGLHYVAELGSPGQSSVAAINNAGQVVGASMVSLNANSSAQHAYVTGPNGAGTKDLGTLTGEGASSATGINDAGQVVGVSYSLMTGRNEAFITDADGTGMRALLPEQVGNSGSVANGINAFGQVTGVYYVDWSDGNTAQSFITGANGVGVTMLGSLGGSLTQATAINNAGQVVGISADESGMVHAFITGANGVGMTNLDTLGGLNSLFSTASGVNATGQVVGQAIWLEGDAMVQHAFITGANGVGMTDLNTLVTLADGVVLEAALGVNDLGQVVAAGSDRRTYLVSPFAVPEPGTHALMLLGLGLIGMAVRRHASVAA